MVWRNPCFLCSSPFIFAVHHLCLLFHNVLLYLSHACSFLSHFFLVFLYPSVPCPWLSSDPTKSPVPTGRTIVKTLLPWDSDESPEASPGPPGPRRGAGAGGPREEVVAPPGPEEQDSLLLQRKSARRCVKQRPSYDIFEDSDDSEPGGPPAPRRRTPRENGANCLLLSLLVNPAYSLWKGRGSDPGFCQCDGEILVQVVLGGWWEVVCNVCSSLLNEA